MGGGGDAYRPPLGRGLLPPPALHPEPPPPFSGVEEGRTQGPAPRPQPSPGAVRGAAEERAPAGLGGEPLAGGPADFLLISSRKPAPCARLRAAVGRGDSRALRASCPPARGGAERGRGTVQRGREGTPGSLGRCQPSAGRWNFEPRRCGAPPASSFCRKRRDSWAGASGEGGEPGGARPRPSFLSWVGHAELRQQPHSRSGCEGTLLP